MGAGLIREDEIEMAKLLPSPSSSYTSAGGESDRALDNDDELEMELARCPLFFGETDLAFPFPPLTTIFAFADSGFLGDLCFLRT